MQCVIPNCAGCDPQESVQELYIPAPYGASLEDIFEYHVTTRNFFAWLYNRPLAGRTLGTALVALKGRVDGYRPDDSSQNELEVLSYAENQRYLDFRECADHALGALCVAEQLHVEDLWVDAFAHCVGMSHRGLRSSIEYAVRTNPPGGSLLRANNGLMNIGRECKVKDTHQPQQTRDGHASDRVNKSVLSFFENEVSGSFLGLPQPAKDHLDKFRSSSNHSMLISMALAPQ